MLEMLESRRLLTSLPVMDAPVESDAGEIRIVTLEEFLQMESWDDERIVVEWYTTPAEGEDEEHDDDWDWELEEEDMSGEDGWLEDVCEGRPRDREPLDEEDWKHVEESDVLEAPIAMSAEGTSAGSFSDSGSIADAILDPVDDEVLD